MSDKIREALERLDRGEKVLTLLEASLDYTFQKEMVSEVLGALASVRAAFRASPEERPQEEKRLPLGQGQSTYDMYAARERAAACAKFNPCPLGESGLPDHNFTCALLCQDCGQHDAAHLPPHESE